MELGTQTERKFISVMICDIAGSYEFLYDQDPEHGKQILDEAINVMLEVVGEFEGHVSQVQGDGLMVLYGAPDSVEDHAERACNTAIHMVRSFELRNRKSLWPFETQVHPKIGISSGEAVVGHAMTVGDEKPSGIPEYIAVGAVSHLAGKLQKLASPDDIIISSSTAEILEQTAELELLAEATVHERFPNHPAPYKLTAINSLRSRWKQRELNQLTPLCGRRSELNALAEQLESTANESKASVLITGQAGIGKSRLIHEFLFNTTNTPSPKTLTLQCNSLQRNTPLEPIRLVIENSLPVQHQSGESDFFNRVSDKLSAIGLPSEHITPILYLMTPDMESSEWNYLEPGIKRVRIFKALDYWFLLQARVAPLIIVVEDYQWADPATAQYFEAFLRKRTSSQILVLFSSRLSSGHQQLDVNLRLHLKPLEGRDAASIAEFHHSDNRLPAKLRASIVKRCGGIPLYVEELSRSIKALSQGQLDKIDHDQSAGVVPEFIRVSIASRVDQLPSAAKKVLLSASVFGVRFDESDLIDLLEGSPIQVRYWIEYLRENGLIQFSQSDERLMFRHDLLQEVIYMSLVRAEKLSAHMTIYKKMAARSADLDAAGYLEKLCYHARHAEAWEELLKSSMHAGEEAINSASYSEAIYFYKQALNAERKLDKEHVQTVVAECWLEISRAYVPLGEVELALDALSECKTAIRDSHNSDFMCEVCLYETCFYTFMKDSTAAFNAAKHAVSLAKASSSEKYQLGADIYLSQVAFFQGDFRQVVDRLQPLIESSAFANYNHLRMGNSAVVGIDAYGNLGMAYAQLGNFDKAVYLGEKSCAAAERAGHSFGVGLANFYLTYIYVHQGQMERSKHSLETVQGLIEEGGIQFLSPWLSGLLGFVEAKEGRLDSAASLIDSSVSESRRMSLKLFEVYALVSKSMLLLERAELKQADAMAREASDLAIEGGFISVQVWIDRLLADITFEAGNFEQAIMTLGNAIEKADQLGMLPDLAHCYSMYAYRAKHNGDEELAQSYATKAKDLYLDMNMMRWVPNMEKYFK